MKAMEGRKVLLVAAVSLLVGMAVVGPAAARPTWVLFGDAKFVKEGMGSDPWALRLRSDANPGYGGVAWIPTDTTTFADLTALSSEFRVVEGDCGGGAPRFSVGIDTNGDGSRDGSVFVYFGPYPNFTGCGTDWQSTGELIGSTELRFDTSQVGGTFYDDYAGALALVGSDTVTSIALVVDAGWMFGTQTVLVDDVTVNDNVLSNPGLGQS